MAPKKKAVGPASGAPAGKAKAKSKCKAKAKAASQGLDERQTSRRQLDRRDTNEQAERSLRIHCGGISDSMLASSTNEEGLTAKELLLRDIREARERRGKWRTS